MAAGSSGRRRRDRLAPRIAAECDLAEAVSATATHGHALDFYTNGQPAMGRPPASITIETDDCRKTVEEFKSRGVEFVSDVFELPWGSVAQFQDPDGNRLQLREGR